MPWGEVDARHPKRVLFVPNYGMVSGIRDSNFLVMFDFWQYLSKTVGCFGYWLVPVEHENELREFLGPKHEVIPFDSGRLDYWAAATSIDMRKIYELFNRGAGKYTIDFVFTSKEIVLSFQIALCRAAMQRYVPVVMFEPQSSYMGAKVQGLAWHYCAMAGNCYAMQIVLNSHEKRLRTRMAKEYLSGQMMQKFNENIYVSGLEVPMALIDQEIKGIKKNDLFTMIYGGRLNSIKKPSTIYQVFSHISEIGMDCKILLSSGMVNAKIGIALKKELKRNPNIEIHSEMDRAGFWKLSAQSHVFCCNSSHESFGLGFLEQLYCGAVGVFPRNDWVLSILPNWYPFLHRGRQEMFTYVKWIHDNYDIAQNFLSRMRHHIEKEYNARKVWGGVLKKMYDLFGRQFTYRLGGKVQELILECVDQLGEEFYFDNLLTKMEKNATSAFIKDLSVRSQTVKLPSNYDIRMFLQSCGYVDLCDNKVMRFRKVVGNED